MRVNPSSLLALATAVAALALSTVKGTAQDIQVVHPTNTVWIYNDSSTSDNNPTIAAGTFWNASDYVPVIGTGINQWKTGGRGLFGNDTSTVYTNLFGTFGNGFRTPLNRSIPDGAGNSLRNTFYFITKFNWPFTPTGVILRGTNWLDDGGVVYLNGVEVFRARQSGTPGTIPGWGDFAGNQGSEGVPEPLEYAATSLVQGENTLAIEVHQSSANSSDLAFTTALRAVIPFAPVIFNLNEPADRAVVENRSTTLNGEGDGSPRPTYQWYKDNAIIPDATNKTYTIARMQPGDAALYHVVLVNEFGSATSRSANVTFVTDNTPPSVARVLASGDHNTVVVEYDEEVDFTSGTDLFSYDVVDEAATTLTVTAVALAPGGKSAILTLGTPMTSDSAYSVHVADVSDLTGRNFVAITDRPLRSWVNTDIGGVLFEGYDTSDVEPGTATRTDIPTLTSHPNFPNNPRDTARITAFSSKLIYPDHSKEKFGGRMRGYFIPPYSGNWVFYLSSDDNGQLFINPNGASVSGKVLATAELGCCSVFAAHATAAYPMIGGQAYYIEALYKEGGGEDYCNVFAALEGVAPPSAAANAVTSADTIQGFMLGAPAAPANVAGTFTITQQPANQTVAPNLRATFSVGTSSDALLAYQWFRDDVEIPNAVGSIYTFIATPADNGARFKVRISIIAGGTVTSTEATLTVEPDVTPPTVLSATATVAGNSVVITYSEPMDAASAGAVGSYSINGAAPSAVTVNSPTTVTLTPATALADCVRYAVVITGVKDSSLNNINPNPTTLYVSKPFVVVRNDDTQIWRFEDTGADLGTAWRAPGFDDSGWVSGAGALGREDESTMPPGWTIRTQMPNWVGARVTTYFRTHFNLATAPASITRLQLNTVVDDGAIYWINGKPLLRLRVATDPADYNTTGDGAPSEAPHPVESFDVPATDLQYGDNVLAIEVHQSGTTSSDVLIGAEMIATVSACVPPLNVARSGDNIIVTWPDPSFRLEKASSVTGPWTSQAGASGVSLPAGSGNLFLRLVSP